MKRLILLLCVLFIFAGCESLPIREIQLGGKYGDFGGDVTLVLSKKATEAENSPVLEDKETGRLHFLLTQDEINELYVKIDALKKNEKQKGAEIKKIEAKEHPKEPKNEENGKIDTKEPPKEPSNYKKLKEFINAS